MSIAKKLFTFVDKLLDQQIENIVAYCRSPEGAKFKITPEGGYAVRLINKTGTTTIKGSLVDLAGGTIDESFTLTEADDFDCGGVVYDSGVPDGGLCWVVISGIADVLLQNSLGSTRGNWVRTSTTTVGRADASNAAPPGLVLQHFAEIGHCLQTVTAGTDKLCRVLLHFN